MSERPQNPHDEQPTSQGGWHSPGEANPWQSPDTQTATSVAWREVKALPDHVEQEPGEPGTWHLPDESDTTFNPDDVVEVSDAPRPTPTTSTVPVASPEDLLAEILGGSQQTAVPRPEDFDYSTGRDEAVTSASDAIEEGETLLVDEEEMTVDAEPLLEIDTDDEAFSMSEYMALANLAQGDDDDLAGLNASDLSPSERAAFSAALNVANEMDSKREQALQEPDIPDDATVTMDDTTEQPANQAAEYARQQLQELDQDDTGAYTQQPAQSQPQQPQYTQEDIELAQQFRETKRQVAVLRQMAQQNQIDQYELQSRLQQHQIYDAQGNWWMVGYESDEWYRYNNQSQAWEEAQPPVPLDAGQVRTETGLGEAAPDVLAGSLPYLPQDGSGAQEFSDSQTLYDDYDNTQYSQSQEAYNQQYPADQSPIRYPNQPTNDPDLTMVGNSVDATQLNMGTDPTVQNMNAVDAYNTMQSNTYQDTVQSNSLGDVIYDDGYDGQGIPPVEEQYRDTGYSDYDAQGVSAPDYEELAGERRARTWTYITIAVVGIIVVGLSAVGGFILYAQMTYTSIIEDWQDEIAALGTAGFDFQTATILAADGTVIAELTGEEGERTVVSIENDDVSPYFIHAIVSSEDPRFYENAGVDPLAIARAFWQNLTAGEVESGASTITQQIVRDRILGSTEVSIDRKFLEALIAIEVANNYSKNQILDIYINEFFYGEQSYGVEAAAEFYFGKTAAELNVAESATLVGILPSPSSENPVVAPTTAFDNMRVILNRMVEANCLNFQHGEWGAQGVPFCINQNTMVDDGAGGSTELFRRNPDGTFGGLLAVQIAQVETRQYEPRQSDIQYPHFVYYVLGELDAAYGRAAYIERGFTVQTTLIPRIQNAAENALQQGVERLGINAVQTGAAIVIDPTTGAIVAMVGSPDFNDDDIDGQNNNTIAPQQPGSAIKPVVYATALSGVNGNYFTPATILWDVPSQYNIGGQIYEPVNYDRQYRGPVSVRHSLAQSLNIPAVKTYAEFDTPAFISTANALGIDFEEEATFGLPTAIGATEVSLMDLTQAYGTIANDGLRTDLYVIQDIQERGVNGTERPVELALSLVPTDPVQAITADVAYLLQNILSDETARTAPVNGVGSSFPANSQISGQSLGLLNSNQVGAKTGTNNTANGNPSRIWTVGFTNNYAVGVWMGTLDSATPMTGNVTGLTGAAPVWNAIMREAINGVNPGEFERPGNVVGDVVCRLTGVLDPDQVTNCPNRVSEIYILTQPPASPENGYVASVSIDSWTGLRANDLCPENVVLETYANIADPFAINWLNGTNRGQQILTQLGLPTNLQSPPTDSCQQGQTLPSVLLSFPQENATLVGQVAFTGQVSADNLQRWEIQISEVGADNFRSIMPQPSTNQIPSRGTVLYEWDSTEIINGAYFIRLEAISTTGGYIQHDVRVTIDNPEPTPIPASPTPIQIEITPLPFATDTPIAP